MINVYFDSGTTNSRIFVLEGGRILYHDKAGTGCRDAALAGDPSILTPGPAAALSKCPGYSAHKR